MKELIVTCLVKKEKYGGYSSLCPELDVASRGDTIEEAQKNLQEAVAGHLQTAQEEGLFDDILERLGLNKKEIKQSEHHITVSTFSTTMTVPMPA